MKQWITEAQYDELKDSQKEAWVEWCWDHHYTMKEVYPFDYYKDKPKMIINFPSIGEMIEFLYEKKAFILPNQEGNVIAWRTDKELCDLLWDNVKEALTILPH